MSAVNRSLDQVRWLSEPVQSTWSHLGLLSLSGVLLALAFPEPGWGWIAHWALAPAGWLAIRSTNAWRLAWCSYAVSMVWWLIRIKWMLSVTVGGHIALSMVLAVIGRWRW